MEFPHLGKTVVVWGLSIDETHRMHGGTTISGLVEIEDFVTTERGSYVVIYDEFGCDYTVDPDELCEQIDPKWYGQMLVSEREMDFASDV
jgi:hypothetical protein